METTTIDCASCGEPAPSDATWCEACGHELSLAPKPACVSCGEREVDPDEGYCLSCGYRQPRERDHLVIGDGPLVAISDRGKRHHHNEDAAALGTVGPDADADALGEGQAGALVLVVCDGVSSTPGSAEASAVASVAARDHLVAGLSGGADSNDADGSDEQEPAAEVANGEIDVAALLVGAVAAAQDRAAGAPEPDIAPVADGPPSSTLVAVVVRPLSVGASIQGAAESGDGSDRMRYELSTAWVGDSRAYWVSEDDAVALSGPDHELDGSLVRWLGADSVDPTPDIDVRTVSEPGHLVVCTDGLWRYAASPAELASLVRRLTSEGQTGMSLAEAMVDHANEGGGHDNITVALWSNRPDWPTDVSTNPSIASAAATDPER
ncbi:MAG: protein phosphatase 2C domain-containing protein [Actinomycetota bacterium]